MLAASLLAIRLAGAGWFLGPPAATSSEIEWQVPLACPDARWLDRRIEAYLGRPLSVADRALVRARRLGGRVERLRGFLGLFAQRRRERRRRRR